MRILDGIFDGVSYEKFQAVFFLQDSVRTQKGIQVFEVFDLLFSRFSWLWLAMGMGRGDGDGDSPAPAGTGMNPRGY
jgi:hypothetical protein